MTAVPPRSRVSWILAWMTSRGRTKASGAPGAQWKAQKRQPDTHTLV